MPGRLWDVYGFHPDETRSFLATLAESSGVQILALDEVAVVVWCDVTSLTFEACATSAG